MRRLRERSRKRRKGFVKRSSSDLKKRLLRSGKSIVRTFPRNSRRRKRRANKLTQTVSRKQIYHLQMRMKSTFLVPNSRRNRREKTFQNHRRNLNILHPARRVEGKAKL